MKDESLILEVEQDFTGKEKKYKHGSCCLVS